MFIYFIFLPDRHAEQCCHRGNTANQTESLFKPYSLIATDVIKAYVPVSAGRVLNLDTVIVLIDSQLLAGYAQAER